MTEQTLLAARTILATPRAIFRAFIDPDVQANWRAPGTLTAELLAFDPRVGGGYKLSLAPTGDNGTTTDTGLIVEADFVEFLAGEKIIESIAYRVGNDAPTRPATVTTTLRPVADGTKVSVLAENLPPSLCEWDREAGLASILKKLANLLE